MLDAAANAKTPVLGVTGTGGAGKSSLTDELVRRFRLDQRDRLKIAIVSVDPSRRKSGGALLGDRIRMNAIGTPNIYMRSLATRGAGSEISEALPDAVAACKAAGFDLVIVETSGIGQGDAAIVPHVDVSLYVMTPEFGAASQLEKIDMLDFADFVAINKFDRKGAQDALRDVRKQYQRNREVFRAAPEEMPVYGTIASRFNDDGVTALYQAIVRELRTHGLAMDEGTLPSVATRCSTRQHAIVPASRVRYLAEIAETVRGYHAWALAQARVARERQQLRAAKAMLAAESRGNTALTALDKLIAGRDAALRPTRARKLLDMWPRTQAAYGGDEYVVKIRDREIRTALTTTSLSGTKVRKVALPRYEDDGEILRWQLTGERARELSRSRPAYSRSGARTRIRRGCSPVRAMRTGRTGASTCWPTACPRSGCRRHSTRSRCTATILDRRPDIYGKVGVLRRLDCDARRHEGALLRASTSASRTTSVSMTINGPAPTILAMFFNTAIDQQLDKFAKDNNREPTDDEADKIRAWTLTSMRGTVQADILKEDQGQNTCIFSTEFSLKVMGDVQEYLAIRN